MIPTVPLLYTREADTVYVVVPLSGTQFFSEFDCVPKPLLYAVLLFLCNTGTYSKLQ